MQTESTVITPMPASRAVRGRKDADKQEKIIEPDVIRKSLPELIALHRKAIDAGDKYSDAIKAQAEKAGVLASVLRKFVRAVAKDQREEKKREHEQLCLLLDEVKVD